ncbi:MAG TPA: hypothetical protein VE360_02925, partial [Pyrinomonadaceae bacterium]|nr:hypothetical protein [Pyrinomonadaceae bacterium]
AFQGSNGGGQNNHDDAYVVKIGNTSPAPAPAPTPTPTPTPTPAPTPAADTVAIQRVEYAASRRQLRVNATSTSPTAALKAYVTATGAFIGTLDGRGGKYSGQFSWPTNPQNITVRSSLGGSASAPVIVK